MEVVDELLTPGCPNCAIKHLSAALAYLADLYMPERNAIEFHPISTSFKARAYVNLIESAEGYHSHLDFAIGLLQRAEEAHVFNGESDQAVSCRNYRVELIKDGARAVRAVTFALQSELGGYAIAQAHLAEAHRELRSFITCVPPLDADVILKMIVEIRKEYFDFQPPAVGEESNNKGESVMAIAKKTAAKTAAKAPTATKAACKGGKCASKKGCKK